MNSMKSKTTGEEHVAGESGIKDSPVWPGADVAATQARPVLKQVPLSLVVAVRNPRHTRSADYASDASYVRHPSHAVRSMRTNYGAIHDATSTGNSEPAGMVTNTGAGTGPGTGPGAGPGAGIDPELEGLARSLGSQDQPRLAEPPVVEEMPDGTYRLCAGERRVEAARLAGWTDILCIVYPPMDPARAHTLGLVENMHRLPMHPLEEISALCISRLLANADARGTGEEARQLLQEGWEQTTSSYSIIQGLERILRDSGWVRERPDVTWKAHLDDLGISMAPWERKRKLRLLNIEPALQERLRELNITEAALRSLGTLEPDDQERVVEALAANPSLARKVRRVARARRDGFYTSIEDALAEVQGLQGGQGWPRSEPPASPASPTAAVAGTFTAGTEPTTLAPHQPHLLYPSNVQSQYSPEALIQRESQVSQVPPEVQDAVLQLLECADRLSATMSSLEAYGGRAALPEPWSSWSRDALKFIARQLAGPEDINAHRG
jgi:ParB-like chromosome segregation protein Spo0J